MKENFLREGKPRYHTREGTFPTLEAEKAARTVRTEDCRQVNKGRWPLRYHGPSLFRAL